jgi:hypothetical protein
MKLKTATTDELFTALQEIDATPHYGSDRVAHILAVRAARIEDELASREENAHRTPNGDHDDYAYAHDDFVS